MVANARWTKVEEDGEMRQRGGVEKIERTGKELAVRITPLLPKGAGGKEAVALEERRIADQSRVMRDERRWMAEG